MWVAEAFIPLEGRRTIEIMVEDCLEELSRRSMVQVLSRSANGLIKHFKVHDILHDLAMHEAEHENFVTVFSQASDDKMPNKIIRRASLQAQEKNEQFLEYVGANTRSLLLFGTRTSGCHIMSLNCSNFRLLKVLEIVGIKRHIFVLKSFDELIHLKYLGLRGCDVGLSSFSCHNMKRLETLDVRGSNCSLACDDLWKIGTLMHVLVDFRNFFDGPVSKGILMRNLQTMKWVTIKRACYAKLPNMRKIGIRNECNEWVSITNLLQTLHFLVSLGIAADADDYLPMEIVYPKTLPNYKNLQSLQLNGKWPENVNVEASLLPPHLIKLTLEWSALKHNPMPELGKMNSLKKLCLEYRTLNYDWKDPIICPEGFPVLQYLKVGYNSNVNDLTVAKGVMPKLTYLQVEKDTVVHLPPELQHVTVQRG